jgi:nucleoside-diphosphate-sugar epimerase
LSKYLVTGGAGFIGSHIVDRLVRDGHQVNVLDNFFTGKMAHIEHNLGKITLFRGDLLDMAMVRHSVEGVDYVLHQAALRSVPKSVEDPLPYCDVNLKGTLNLLLASRDAGVKRLVFASSSSVYGNNPALPKKEEMPVDPISPYAVTKAGGEQYCRMFTKLYGLETVSLRYFNVFGPRQDPASQYATVIPKFILAINAGESPVIFGDGTQSRDFTFVRNNVEANILAATSPPEVAGEVLNIACGDRYDLLFIVDAINRFLGTSVEPIFEAPRAGDVMHTQGDASKAELLIGWRPAVGFLEGLEEMVKWTVDNLATYRM